MDLNAFWVLVEASSARSSDRDVRQGWPAAALAGLPCGEVVESAARLVEPRRRAGPWVLWHAAAVADASAEVRELAVRGGTRAWGTARWPEWQGLACVAAEVAGSLPRGLLPEPAPAGVPWDFAGPAAIAARVPRVGSLFGKVA